VIYEISCYSAKEKKMNTVELLQFSVDTAFNILGLVTDDLTQEMADWQPPKKANSITANYAHILNYIDFLLKEVLIPFDDTLFQEDRPKEIVLHDVQVELSDLHKRAHDLRKSYHDWLSSLNPSDLDAKMNSSVGPLNVGQIVEIYVAWHINVHCGEISCLKGCQGAKGYPW
jgi:hypothetical protein